MRAAAFKRTLTSRHDVKTGFSILALALLALALTAGPAAAEAPSATIGSASSVSYASAHVTGTVDPADHFTFYSFEYSTDGVTWSEFAFEGAFEENSGPHEVSVNLAGLKGGTTYFVRLAATNFEDPEAISANAEFTTLPVTKPTAVSATPGATTYTTAAVSGSLERPANPDPAFDAECRFEYVTDAQFKAAGFEGAGETLCTPKNLTSAGASPVTATITGLARGTVYHLRLRASNAGGSNVVEAASTFTTTTAPQAQTLGAGSVTTSSATLAGNLNPDNAPVTYQFEWGTSSSYGNVSPAAAESLPTANESFALVTAPLTGLQPTTTYHYRIAATNTQTNEVSHSQDRAFTTLSVSTTGTCPNESSRTGSMATLPDCRAYELASPGLNGASLGEEPKGHALPDGSGVAFETIDAPDHAEGSTVFNWVVARRTASGWSTYGLAPPLVEPVDGFQADYVEAVSPDLSRAIIQIPQKLAGPSSPSGIVLYLREPDGTFRSLENFGMPYSPGIEAYSAAARRYQTPDFSHVYYSPCVVNQLPSDPLPEGACFGNLYQWANGTLSLVGILPGPSQTPAPTGADLAVANVTIEPPAALPPTSDDGEYVSFYIRGLTTEYLRERGQNTVEVSASQRTVPDPNPVETPKAVGVTVNGSAVLFTSASELTNDANTGTAEGEGIANDSGRDLYSYDVKTGKLTDLTPDSEPADIARGANVQRVVAANPEASFVYFIATGKLAPGGVSGLTNLYVEHEGKIDYVAPAVGVSVTPDGRHAVFNSTESLTGYDNVNPNTSSPESEVFEYTYGGGLVCVSCRPGGAPPTGGSGIVPNRTVSDDGSRVFFESSDVLVPQASNDRKNLYEYEDGEVHLLSPGDGDSRVVFLDASASGDDVFFATHGELVPGDQGTASSVYDARVDAVIAASPPPECEGEGCRAGALPSPVFGAPGSTSSGAGNPQAAALSTVNPSKTTAAAARAKKLAKALKACRRDRSKAKRLKCERQARKRYQPAHKGAK